MKNKKWLWPSIAIGIFLAVEVALIAASGTIQTWTGKGSRRNTVEMELLEPTVGAAANLVPGTDNTNALGTSSLRWSDVQTNDLTAADDVTVTGDATISGNVTATNGTTTTSSFTATTYAWITLRVSTEPRTMVTTTAKGQLIMNTTADELCFSTGSSGFSWVRVSTPSLACQN